MKYRCKTCIRIHDNITYAGYYDPNIGRFLTQDSYKGEIREANTWNLYAYCHGNPINFIDPTGHDAIWLQQKSGAMGMGHTAVAIQLGKTNQWAYFSFSSATPSNIAKNLVGAKMKITNNRISLVTEIRERGKVVAKTSRKAQTNDLVNKVKKSKDGVTYDGTAYIEGDFSKGLSYLRRKKKEEKRLKYYLLGGGNCKDYVVTALSQGTKVKNNLYFRSSLNNAASFTRFFSATGTTFFRK